MPLPKPAPPLHARNASAAIGGKACEQIRLETQEKVKKAAADVALEALDSSEHIKARHSIMSAIGIRCGKSRASTKSMRIFAPARVSSADERVQQRIL